MNGEYNEDAGPMRVCLYSGKQPLCDFGVFECVNKK